MNFYVTESFELDVEIFAIEIQHLFSSKRLHLKTQKVTVETTEPFSFNLPLLPAQGQALAAEWCRLYQVFEFPLSRMFSDPLISRKQQLHADHPRNILHLWEGLLGDAGKSGLIKRRKEKAW